MINRKVKQSRFSTVAEALGIVAGRDEEVCKDSQLVLGECLFVLCPVVLVGSLEVLQNENYFAYIVGTGNRTWKTFLTVAGIGTGSWR